MSRIHRCGIGFCSGRQARFGNSQINRCGIGRKRKAEKVDSVKGLRWCIEYEGSQLKGGAEEAVRMPPNKVKLY